MRILITGSDGYEGWPLLLHLAAQGHEVTGVDNMARRGWVHECGAQSVMPIATKHQRRRYAETLGATLVERTISGTKSAAEVVEAAQPDVVIHLAEQPSAPYSMRDSECAAYTRANNTGGTGALLWAIREHAPNAHLIYVSTMGEYGTPGVPIPEGVFPPGIFDPNGDVAGYDIAGMQFPRKGGSVYHDTKIASGAAVDSACRTWGLRATTMYQGVVAGIGHPACEMDEYGRIELQTRFDVDEAFGTVFNRFCAQAVLGIPLTLYGTGEQQRGFISLYDTVLSLGAAAVSQLGSGEHRHCNQITEIFSMKALAELVRDSRDGDCMITTIPNPRVESASHSYKVATDNFRELYPAPKVTLDMEVVIVQVMLEKYREQLEEVRAQIAPKTEWRAGA